MTTIGPDGKIVTQAPAQPTAVVPALVPAKAAPAFSKVTHILALVLGTVAAFLVSPAGQALILQYPHLSVVAGLITGIAALYKTPQADV